MSQRSDDGMESGGPSIETLMLANHAEAINGLLYLVGGCWTTLTRPGPLPDRPAPNSHFGIAVSILVPWTDTNRPVVLTVHIEREDGGDPIVHVQGNIEVGRPPGVPPGSDQRAVLAINVDTVFQLAGGHRVVAELSTGARRTTSFQVLDAPS